jgi:hypothetical protein
LTRYRLINGIPAHRRPRLLLGGEAQPGRRNDAVSWCPKPEARFPRRPLLGNLMNNRGPVRTKQPSFSHGIGPARRRSLAKRNQCFNLFEFPRRPLLGSSVDRDNPLLTPLSLSYLPNPFRTTTLTQHRVSPCPFLSLPLHLIPDRSAVLSLRVPQFPPETYAGLLE